MKICMLSSENEVKWDDFVYHSRDGTPYHLLAWKNVVEKTYGHQPLYLMAEDEEKIKGVLPLFLVNSKFFGRALISVPHAIYGGICADSEEAENLLLEEAKCLAKHEKVSYLELRELCKEREGFLNDKSYVTLIYTVPEVFSLTSFRSEIRNRIKKAISSGLEVWQGVEYIGGFHDVFLRNMRDLGSPDFGLKFFENLIKEFYQQVKVLVVTYQKKIIGGLVAFGFKQTFMVPWVSSLKGYHNLCPNNILYYEAIKYAYQEGYKGFDFGRSESDSGTFTFKKRWGAEPKQLYYNYITIEGKKRPVIYPTNPKFAIFISVWKHLPVSCAKVLGPRIMRFIP